MFDNNSLLYKAKKAISLLASGDFSSFVSAFKSYYYYHIKLPLLARVNAKLVRPSEARYDFIWTRLHGTGGVSLGHLLCLSGVKEMIIPLDYYGYLRNAHAFSSAHNPPYAKACLLIDRYNDSKLMQGVFSRLRCKAPLLVMYRDPVAQFKTGVNWSITLPKHISNRDNDAVLLRIVHRVCLERLGQNHSSKIDSTKIDFHSTKMGDLSPEAAFENGLLRIIQEARGLKTLNQNGKEDGKEDGAQSGFNKIDSSSTQEALTFNDLKEKTLGESAQQAALALAKVYIETLEKIDKQARDALIVDYIDAIATKNWTSYANARQVSSTAWVLPLASKKEVVFTHEIVGANIGQTLHRIKSFVGLKDNGFRQDAKNSYNFGAPYAMMYPYTLRHKGVEYTIALADATLEVAKNSYELYAEYGVYMDRFHDRRYKKIAGVDTKDFSIYDERYRYLSVFIEEGQDINSSLNENATLSKEGILDETTLDKKSYIYIYAGEERKGAFAPRWQATSHRSRLHKISAA